MNCHEYDTYPLFEVYRGDDFTFDVEIVDDLGSFLDIKNWSFQTTFKLNPRIEDSDSDLIVDIPSSRLNVNSEGKFSIPISSEQSKKLFPRIYFVSVNRILGERVTTLINMRVNVIPT